MSYKPGLGALVLSFLFAGPALADDALGNRGRLHVGPLIGGQDLTLDLRTNVPNAPFLLLYGLDGTPQVLPQTSFPVLGVGAGGFLTLLPTDVNGRFKASVPTSLNQYVGLQGLPLFFHAIYATQSGQKVATNVKATIVEPTPVPADFLVDVSATRLPVGYDTAFAANLFDVDIDKDGDLDLVFARGELDVGVWENDGTGTFTDVSASSISFPGDPLSHVTMGDFDGDGDFDLITAGGFDDLVSVPDRLWRNDGSGVFTQDVGFPAGEGLTSSVSSVDVDNDGDLDLIVANGPEGHLSIPLPGSDQLFFNDGSGTFTKDTAFENALWNDEALITSGVAVGDIDSDGDFDLFLARSDINADDGVPGEVNVLLENQGDGTFVDVSTRISPLYEDNSGDAEFADIDGDGDLDILVANSVLSVPVNISGDVLVNQGGLQGGTEGFYADDPASFLEPNTPADAIRLTPHAEDIDGDGDIDVLMTVHDLFFGADQMLFLNQGGAEGGTEGTMVRQLWYDPGDFISYGASLFDMDNDGDLDVIQTASGVVTGDPIQAGQVRLFENTTL